MGALSNHCYARISKDYYDTHTERQSDSVVNLPCNERNVYCDTCGEFIVTGYPLPSGDPLPVVERQGYTYGGKS